MGTRKGEDTLAAKKRRMPFVAKIRREDPFRIEDQREIHAMCRRVAAASEFCMFAGWREDAGFLVYHFTTWAKARALQYWIDRSGVSKRPAPKLGLSKEEKAAEAREALAWAMNTGAIREMVQTYRLGRFQGDDHLTAFNAACDVAKTLDRPVEKLELTTRAALEWAKEHHREWFYRYEAQTIVRPAPRKATADRRRPSRAEPEPPRWRPTF